ncbi:MAG: SpoIIIAH-like family protein [Bacillota bacterium]|nr:SpoIIIAH-like family protein [Bacillota bacterium]
MVIKKGSAVGAVVVLMLCVAVYLNWSYTRPPEEDLTAAKETEETGKILGESKLVENTQEEDLEETKKESSEGEDKANEEEGADTGYFARARLTRQRARDEAMSILKETAADQKVDEKSRDKASTELASMAAAAVRESRIENLIMAKGYTDCVVSISDQKVTVVVKAPADGLKDQDAAKIADIVMDEAAVDASQIKIIETN